MLNGIFATSHGKSSYDAIGGMIKRLAAIESLKRPYNNQIIKLIELLKFCEENIKSVLCILVTIEEIALVRHNYKKEAKTIPGTRSFHQFFVHNKNIIKCKHSNFDDKCALNFDLKGKVVKSWKTDNQDLESEISLLIFNSVTKNYSFPNPTVILIYLYILTFPTCTM